ncbi:MAG: hypothetical protein OER95_10840, partial [Acidimicrobiia bacterium]|nr:hypothetical protein [Acidimicrobiia bacterium]
MTTLIDSDKKERETELPPTRSLAPAPRPYLWLGIGAVLLVFSNGILSVVPLATWLAPLFLIRYLRTQPLK